MSDLTETNFIKYFTVSVANSLDMYDEEFRDYSSGYRKDPP